MPSPLATPPTGKVLPFRGSRPSDAELLNALVRGETSALGEIYRRHVGHIERFLRAQLGQDAPSEDLAHEVFLGLWRTAPQVRDGHHLRAYLLGAAVRTARMERRRLGRQRRWFGLWHSEQETTTRSVPAEERDLLALLRGLLDQLGEREREAYILRYVEELPPTEVALALGVSVATAKRVVNKARDHLLAKAKREPGLLEYLTKQLQKAPPGGEEP